MRCDAVPGYYTTETIQQWAYAPFPFGSWRMLDLVYRTWSYLRCDGIPGPTAYPSPSSNGLKVKPTLLVLPLLMRYGAGGHQGVRDAAPEVGALKLFSSRVWVSPVHAT